MTKNEFARLLKAARRLGVNIEYDHKEILTYEIPSSAAKIIRVMMAEAYSNGYLKAEAKCEQDYYNGKGTP